MWKAGRLRGDQRVTKAQLFAMGAVPSLVDCVSLEIPGADPHSRGKWTFLGGQSLQTTKSWVDLSYPGVCFFHFTSFLYK